MLALVKDEDRAPAKPERDPEAIRFMRLWDVNKRQGIPRRNYSVLYNAHIGAWITARLSEIGTTIEIYNVRTQKLLGRYERKVNTVAWHDPEKGPDWTKQKPKPKVSA